MIALEILLRRVAGVAQTDLERWIARGWVRPAEQGGRPMFTEIDVARIRLIVELRDHMEVAEPAMPVVLGLLDQLYDERRRLRRLREAIERAGLAERLGRDLFGG